MRCRLAFSKSNESTAGTRGLVSVPLGTRSAVLGGIVTTGSAVTLTFFLGNFEDEFEVALRFCLDTVAVSLGIGASRLEERVLGILCVIALSNNCMYRGEMTKGLGRARVYVHKRLYYNLVTT